MARINLLPWREAERQRRTQEYGLIVVGVAILAGLAGLFVHLSMEDWIEFQSGRNAMIEREIKQYDKAIAEIAELDKEKQRLIERMKVIQQLQESRPEIVHLFDEIIKEIPEGVYFNRIAQTGKVVTLEGKAESNARVSSLMRNIDRSAWTDAASLKVIQNPGQGKGLSSFTLTALQANKNKKPEAAQDKRPKGGRP